MLGYLGVLIVGAGFAVIALSIHLIVTGLYAGIALILPAPGVIVEGVLIVRDAIRNS